MGDDGITIEWNPPIEAVREIYRETGKALDLKYPHGRVATFLDRWVQGNFKTEGGEVGGWPEFAHEGRIVKDKNGKAHIDRSAKLLQHTGRLRLSMLPFSSNESAGVGSALPYARKHQEGDAKDHLPARRMMPEYQDVAHDVADIYDQFIREVWGKFISRFIQIKKNT